MQNNIKYNFGFTLVELLVVIAIIGILSSVAVVNLRSGRDKARLAAVRASLASLTPAIILCHDDGHELAARFNVACPGGVCYCTTNNAIPWVGQPICEDSQVLWPNIVQNGFSYLECDSDPVANTWNVMVTNGDDFVFCTRNGCSVL